LSDFVRPSLHSGRGRPPSAMPSTVMDVAKSHGYTDFRTIGKGSFGTATLVRDNTGRLCVMKSVDSLEPQQQKAAAAEVMMLASLKHPYIIRYYRSFVSKSSLAIVMEYAEGGDLQNRIKETKQAGRLFPEPQVRRWLAQTVLGLKYLHGRSILHRDLKPHNLFLTTQDNIRIGDFGISKVQTTQGPLTDSSRLGSPSYMAPEVCTDGLYSFASDMWALGCVLYEMCALTVAFDCPSSLAPAPARLRQLITRITRAPAPVLPAAYSLELRTLCSELLSRDRRPSSADVIQSRIVQGEITQMMLEEREAPASETGSLNGSGSFAGSARPSTSSVTSLGSLKASEFATPQGVLEDRLANPMMARCATPMKSVKEQRGLGATEEPLVPAYKMAMPAGRCQTPLQNVNEQYGLAAAPLPAGRCPSKNVNGRCQTPLQNVNEQLGIGPTEPIEVNKRKRPAQLADASERWPKAGSALAPLNWSHCERRGSLAHSGSATVLMPRRSPKNRGPMSPKNKRGGGPMLLRSASSGGAL